MKTTLEALSEKNLEIGIQLQAEIFRMEPYKNDLINSLTGEIADYFSLQKHWLIKANGKYVGITGLYAYKEYLDDAWLAWFGVIESERRKGYTSDVLKKYLIWQEKKVSKVLGYTPMKLKMPLLLSFMNIWVWQVKCTTISKTSLDK